MLRARIPLSDRKDVIREAQALLDVRPLYLDTETNGLHSQAEVIEIGIVDADGTVLIDQRIRPRGSTMDPGSLRVHGITLEELKNEPTWDIVWPQVEPLLSGHRIIAYNFEFDLKMMQQSHSKSLPFEKWTLPAASFTDLMTLYARFYGEWDPFKRSYRLQSLDLASRQCNLSRQNTHRAVDDCLVARDLLHHIASST